MILPVLSVNLARELEDEKKYDSFLNRLIEEPNMWPWFAFWKYINSWLEDTSAEEDSFNLTPTTQITKFFLLPSSFDNGIREQLKAEGTDSNLDRNIPSVRICKKQKGTKQ